jgi:hypothetical protein
MSNSRSVRFIPAVEDAFVELCKALTHWVRIRAEHGPCAIAVLWYAVEHEMQTHKPRYLYPAR